MDVLTSIFTLLVIQNFWLFSCKHWREIHMWLCVYTLCNSTSILDQCLASFVLKNGLHINLCTMRLNYKLTKHINHSKLNNSLWRKNEESHMLLKSTCVYWKPILNLKPSLCVQPYNIRGFHFVWQWYIVLVLNHVLIWVCLYVGRMKTLLEGRKKPWIRSCMNRSGQEMGKASLNSRNCSKPNTKPKYETFNPYP